MMKNLRKFKSWKQQVEYVKIEDFQDYCPGLETNGGRYIGFIRFDPTADGWKKYVYDSSEFSDPENFVGELTDEEMMNLLNNYAEMSSEEEAYTEVYVRYTDGSVEIIKQAVEQSASDCS